MDDKEYKEHKRALVNRALLLSVDTLKDSVKDEFESPTLPYLVFDAMTAALEKKMGKRTYTEWFNSLAEGESK